MFLKFFEFLMMMLCSQAGEVDLTKTPDDDEIKDPKAVLAKNKELLAALASEKAEKEQLRKEKEEAEKKAKDEELERLKKAEDYKTLYEKSEKEKAESVEREKKKDEALANGAKLASVQTELNKLGINQDRLTLAMRMIDIKSVKYDESLKLVTGGDAEAARIKMLSPEWFGKRDIENMDDGDSGNDGGKPGKMTLEAYLKLPKDKQREVYPQLIKDTTGKTVTPIKRR